MDCFKGNFNSRVLRVVARSILGSEVDMVVEEVETEINQSTSSRLTIDLNMCLLQMPASWSNEKSCSLGIELVQLVAGFVFKGDGPVHSIP
jgi:hypothetical protein